jgi:hypothetical protein
MLAEIDAAKERALRRAEEQRAEVLAANDMRTPWPPELRPNDRDRELALRTVTESNRGDCSMPALVTSFAHALAAYRVELTAPPPAAGKEMRAHDHD